MDGATAHEWQQHGFVILPAYLDAGDLLPAQMTMPDMFPTAEGFHDATDPRRDRYLGDEFEGIDFFPFASVALSRLAVHDRLVALAASLLGTEDLRLYTAEAWAKYTGAADYDQELHRDYLNHTLLVPPASQVCDQVEMFLFLYDVPEGLGPPHLLSQRLTRDWLAVPNWYPRVASEPEDRFGSAAGHPEAYGAEVSGAGPAGTVIAFQPGTMHRGTALTTPRAARYSMHVGFRTAKAEWAQRVGWVDRSHSDHWYKFASCATPRQLALFGFPPPGHPFWTQETVDNLALRYPSLDLTPWRAAVSGGTSSESDR